MANKPSKLGSLTDRPKKSRKREEEIDIENTYEDETILDVYERPRTKKEVFLQIATAILVVAFLMTSGMMCVVGGGGSNGAPNGDPNQPVQQIDDTAQQIERYSKELQEKPGDVAVLANLAYYLGQRASNLEPTEENKQSRMTDLALAEGHLRKALETDPNYAFAQSELGKNLLMQENYEEARKFLEVAKSSTDEGIASDDEKTKNEATNRRAEIIRLLAIADVSEGKVAEALVLTNQALELKPGEPNLYLQRYQIFMQMGDKESARKDLMTLIDVGQKTRNQQAAAIGQALLEQMNKEEAAPAPSGSPAPVPSASPSATPQ